MALEGNNKTDEHFGALVSSAQSETKAPDRTFLAALREKSARAFEEAAAQPHGLRRYLRMARSARWVVPIAAAAGVALVIGLWPNSGNGGRAYAMSDVSDLLRRARTVHLKGVSSRGLTWRPTEHGSGRPGLRATPRTHQARTSRRSVTANTRYLSTIQPDPSSSIVSIPISAGSRLDRAWRGC